MANNMKGITVEIGGNTAPLNDALSSVNKTSRDLQSELREVNRQLKLDPTNTELLTQKQKLLSESVNNTKGKLDTLKEAERQVQEQFARGEVSEEQYRALQREIIKTEDQLKKLAGEAEKSNVSLSKISEGANKVGEASSNISAKMAPVTLAIAGAGIAAANMGSDFIESTNKVEVAFKENAKQIQDWSKTTLDNFGIASGSALDMAALYGDMGTAMGQSTEEASNMSMNLVGLAGDLASFKNIGLDQAQDALKGIFTGEGEALKSLGIIMQDSTLEAYALSTGQKKQYDEMTQAEKVALRYSFVMDSTKNAQGDFARTSDGAANSTRVASESMKEAASSIGVILAPIVARVAQIIADLVQKFTSLDDGTKKVILVVIGLIAAIGPVAGLISGIATIVGTTTVVIGTISGAVGLFTGTLTVATPAATALAGAMTFLTGPFGIAIAIIGGVIAVGVLLYKNWDTVKLKAGELGTYLGDKFNGIKESVISPIRTAADFVGGQVDRIKSFFSGLRIELPQIKLPHFKLNGEFSLMPPRIPTVGVDWYDKGGIFSSPQIIGVGEKRPEFVGALDDLRYLIRDELTKDKGSSIINFNGNYSFNDKNDIDYFMNQAAVLTKRKRG